MNEARVVHVKDNVEGAIYVGRANHRFRLSESVFHNPFVIGQDGDRAAVLDAYRQHIEQRRDLWWMLPGLRGKPLACWCRHEGEKRTSKNACHGDILIELLDRYTDEELRIIGIPVVWPELATQ